ncbi:tyrosine-type recombinase/integrase [Streptomyces sp. NBC_01483]|uniref:tyrosine-type recombinase/integrase n=1 Tax=Streptomyces sp. NBC_01483 TaxID=2903883 RepID=UPI003FCE0B89
MARLTKLPWILGEQQWLDLLAVARDEPVRNRVMLALAYDAALRREELCSLRTDDLDPAHRTLRIRAETTKTRRERVVPYSVATGVLMSDYLTHRATISRARGPLFLSESRRNYGQPLTLWTWSKVIRRVALAADLPRFSTHTTRHLCLTDLARMGWELHAIASFAGHRSTESTLTYIHLSGRDLAEKLNQGMQQIHSREAVASGAAASGEPWQYYDLGHGWCTYTFFEQCQHRMACARCDFCTPKESSKGQLLEAKDNLRKMLANIPLTDDERAAVDDGQTALDKLLERLADIPTPAGPTPSQIGAPATLLQVIDLTTRTRSCRSGEPC